LEEHAIVEGLGSSEPLLSRRLVLRKGRKGGRFANGRNPRLLSRGGLESSNERGGAACRRFYDGRVVEHGDLHAFVDVVAAPPAGPGFVVPHFEW
jgi:hypothetical protein